MVSGSCEVAPVTFQVIEEGEDDLAGKVLNFEGVDLNIQELDTRLRLLGWDDFELDDYTLQLIIAFFEANDDSVLDRGVISIFENPSENEISHMN